MATCDQAREWMQEELDGALRRGDDSALRDHLVSCDGCRRDQARFVALAASLEALPEAEVPEGFADAVMADLPEMLPASEGTGHVLRWGILTAALLTACVAGLGLLVNEGGPEAARQTLQPLGASLQLGGILLAHAAAGIAIGLSAMSETLARTSIEVKVAVVMALAAINATLLAMLTRLRPAPREATRRR